MWVDLRRRKRAGGQRQRHAVKVIPGERDRTSARRRSELASLCVDQLLEEAQQASNYYNDTEAELSRAARLMG